MDDNLKLLLLLTAVAAMVGVLAALVKSRSVHRYGFWGVVKRQITGSRGRSTYID